MPTSRIHLVGAGGHAAVVVDALLATGLSPDSFALWTEDETGARHDVLGCPIGLLQPESLSGQLFHICIGSNTARARLHTLLLAAGALPRTIIHPAAIVSRFATIGPGSFLAARAVVAPRARLGAAVIVNHGAIIDHDCTIADFVHIAPGATLGGAVKISERVLVGAGANILPGLRLGEGATIGAGGVVVYDVPSGAVHAGVPARSIEKRTIP